MKAWLLVLFGALSLSMVSASAAEDPWDTPDSKWRLGPVKYLLTKEEDQQYKKLKTGEERARFVEEFWKKRDHSQDTPENEFRDEFYRFAREAAAQFTEDNGKGWQDDRGRVYILFGKPDETTEASSLLEAGAPSGAGDFPSGAGGGLGIPGGGESRPQTSLKTVRFVYHRNPLTGKAERLELHFRQEITGGYRLEERIDWSAPILRGLAPMRRAGAAPAAGTTPPAQPPAAGASPAPPGPPAPKPPEVAPAAPEATPQSELMQQVRSAADLAATVPLDVTVNFYKAAKGTFATLTLEVKRSSLSQGADPSALILAAEIVDLETGASLQRFFKADQFGGAEGNSGASASDILLYQAARPIEPGKYRAIFAVKEQNSSAVGKLEKELAIPSYEEETLALSSVTLARKVEPLVDPPPAEQLTPFVLGNFKVVPRPDNVYKQGEELSFYFQIYGATLDPGTSTPKVDLSYAFEKKVGDQWKMVGGRPLLTPGQTGLVQAYSLTMTGWPAGEYRVSIKVTDTLISPPRTVAADMPFSILAPAGASKARTKSKG